MDRGVEITRQSMWRWRPALATVAATVAVLVSLELALRGVYTARDAALEVVPLPYLMDAEYGPSPPWADRLHILMPDPVLLWKGVPGVHRRYVDVFQPAATLGDRIALRERFLPTLPAELRGAPTWEVSLDSEGFRESRLAPVGSGPPFRIACLGDSWTFGANVDVGATFPRQLAARLDGEYPHAGFEVRNLGVLGYSSYQGLELLRRRVLDLHPDIVVLGFAMNDSSVAGQPDRQVAELARAPSWASRLERVTELSELFKLLRYVALRTHYRPPLPSEHLRKLADAPDYGDARAYDELAQWTRVPLESYAENTRAMVDLALRHGAEVVLLYDEFWQESPYRAALQRVAAERSVPWIDASALIASARSEVERNLEQALGLRPAGSYPALSVEEGLRVVFRVSARNQPVAEAIYITGPSTALGGGVPNTVALNDDGIRGDERAHDGVWSRAAALEPGTKVVYVYTNSGRPGLWEGLDVPSARQFRTDSAMETGTVYRPIETFGRLYLHADAYHTDRSGYALIADALFETIRSSQAFRAYLARATAQPDT